MADRYRIIVTPQAQTDLDAVADYIGAHASAADADRVVTEIGVGIVSLVALPARFQQVGQGTKRGTTHRLVIAPYVVYYRVEPGPAVVRVLTVRHGARRPLKRFE